MRRLARLLVRIFFRRIEVEGLGDLSRDGPTVLVANHINGPVDALLLMVTLPRFPRVLGKATATSWSPPKRCARPDGERVREGAGGSTTAGVR